MDGRDRRIPNKYNSLHFMAAPELREMNNHPINQPLSKPTYDALMTPQSKKIQQGAEAGVMYILNKKKDAIDRRFGKGASDWVLGNLDQFDPEEKFKLYYMFEQLQ